MHSPEQDHINFSIPVFIAIKDHISISALKEVVVGILYHVTQITKRIITNMVSKKITA